MRVSDVHTLSIALAAVVGLVVQSPQSGTIRGSITVAGTSESLAGVQVTASSDGVQRTTFTDATGHYEISDLASGTYEVIAELDGFRPATRLEAQVSGIDAVVVDFTMEFGILETILGPLKKELEP